MDTKPQRKLIHPIPVCVVISNRYAAGYRDGERGCGVMAELIPSRTISLRIGSDGSVASNCQRFEMSLIFRGILVGCAQVTKWVWVSREPHAGQ